MPRSAKPKPYNYDVAARMDGGSRSHARHGDIFTNQGYRHTKSVIASRDSRSGVISFIKNPDESGSGYLTIPAQILAPVSDAIAKYDLLISQPQLAPAFNMHISPHDTWLLDKIGEEAVAEAEGWDFDLHFSHGTLQEVFIKPPNEPKAHLFSLPLHWPDIKDFFENRDKPQGWFVVKVVLDEEDLQRYRQKHSPNKKYGWLTTKPDLGLLWSLEPGKCGVKEGENYFEWKLLGPLDTMAQTLRRIKDWFAGFPYGIKKCPEYPDSDTEETETYNEKEAQSWHSVERVEPPSDRTREPPPGTSSQRMSSQGFSSWAMSSQGTSSQAMSSQVMSSTASGPPKPKDSG